MAQKFLGIGPHFYNPQFVKRLTCNGPKKGCEVIIANTATSSGFASYNKDETVKFTCDNLSKCPIRTSGICHFSDEETPSIPVYTRRY